MSSGELYIQPVSDQQPARDPLLQGVSSDLRLELEALGFPVAIETNDSRIANVASQLFEQRSDASATESEVVLRLLVHDVPEEPGWTPRQPVLRAQGDHFYAAASRASVVSGDSRTGFAFGFVSHRQADHTEHLRSTMVMSPILMTLTQRSLSAIHCAVVTLGETTIMLRGTPNAGKTTTAYAALRHGFALLCEDVAFAFNGPAGIELRGMPKLMYLKPDAPRFFPELEGLESLDRYNGEQKIMVEVARRFPGQTVQSAPLGPAVFVARSPDGDNSLHPISDDEALQMFEATRIAVEQRYAGELDIWGAMIAQGAYRLDVGPDPIAAIGALRELCES